MNKNQPAFFNVGGATLLMLFAVLCLTVFAVLSLISAKSQSALVQKSADAVTAYYQADTRAAEIYDEVAAGNLSSVKITDLAAVPGYTYSVKIDGNQELPSCPHRKQWKTGHCHMESLRYGRLEYRRTP